MTPCSPTQLFTSLPKVQQLSTGDNEHFLALVENGTLWDWGRNGYGQLGLGDQEKRASPQQVMGLPQVTVVKTTSHYTQVITVDNSVWSKI